MQFGNPVSHPPSPAALTLLCWECTRRGKERIWAGSTTLVLPWSFLLAALYSIWKTKIVSFLVQSLAENRKELRVRVREREREGERDRETERERDERKKEHRTILVSFPRQRLGAPQPAVYSALLLLLFSISSHSTESYLHSASVCDWGRWIVQCTT